MKKQFEQHRRKDRVKWCITAFVMFLVIVTIAGLCLQVFGSGKAKPTEWFNKDETAQSTSYNSTHETAGVYTSAVSAFTSDSIDSVPRVVYTETNTITDGAQLKHFSEVLNNNSYDGIRYSVIVTFDYSQFNGDVSADGSIVSVYAVDTSYDGMNETILLGAKRLGDGGNSHVVGYATWGKYNGWGYEYSTTVEFDILDEGYQLYDSFDKFSFFLTEKELSFAVDYSGNIATKIFTSDSVEYNSFYNLVVSGKLTSYFGNARENIEYITIYPLTYPTLNDGQVFGGWYYDNAYTRPYDGQIVDKYTPIYSKIETIRYRVAFSTGYEAQFLPQTVDWGTVLTPPSVFREGYTLLGWYLSDGTLYTNQPITEENTSRGRITLHARWEAAICTVTFYVDNEVYSTKSFEYGTAFSEVVNVATTMNLQVMSLCSSNDTATESNIDKMMITGDIDVTAVEMGKVDKVVNTVKNNKLLIVYCVAGGVGLIILVVFICKIFKRHSKSVKHKKRV